MALDIPGQDSNLENVQVWDTFNLTQNAQALCKENNSFQQGDILEITSKQEKQTETSTTRISFNIIRWSNSQSHIFSSNVFANTFENKVEKIDNITVMNKTTSIIIHKVNNLVLKA